MKQEIINILKIEKSKTHSDLELCQIDESNGHDNKDKWIIAKHNKLKMLDSCIQWVESR